MESIVSAPMIAYLRTNQLISKEQYGFLAKRYTGTQLLTTINDYTLQLLADNKMRIDAVYIDFAKAFDSVSHDKPVKVTIFADDTKLYSAGCIAENKLFI